MKKLTLILFCIILIKHAVLAQDWPQEHGINSNGYTPADTNWLTSWSVSGPPVAWKGIVGVGACPPAIVNDRIYIYGSFKKDANVGGTVTADMVPDTLSDRWAIVDGSKIPVYVDDWAMCIDGNTGQYIWKTKIASNSPMCNTWQNRGTPLVKNGKVYFHTFWGILSCLDATTGNIVWSHNFPSEYGMNNKTEAGAPLMGNFCAPAYASGNIVVSIGIGVRGPMKVIAFNAETGVESWVKSLNNPADPGAEGYAPETSSLTVAPINGKETIILSTGVGTIGLDAANNGNELWYFKHEEKFPDLVANRSYNFYKKYPYHVTKPLVWNDIVIDRIFSGHGSSGSRTYAFKVKEGNPELMWYDTNLSSRWVKFVIVDSMLIGIDLWTCTASKGEEFYRIPRPMSTLKSMQCKDIKTGALLWSSDIINLQTQFCILDSVDQGAYSYTYEPTFSVAGNRLIACTYGTSNMNNKITVAKVSRTAIKKLAQFQFSISNKGLSFSLPIYSNGRIYFRQCFEKNYYNSSMVCFDVRIDDAVAPSVPMNLVTSNISSSSLMLSWQQSTDNIGVTKYIIYKDGIVYDSTANLTISISELSPTTNYDFFVKAKDAKNNVSAASNTVTVTTSAPDTQAPTAPSNLTASNVSYTSATLTWTASTDNVAVSGYNIYKAGVKQNTNLITALSFTLNGLSDNSTYTYTVKAVDAENNISAASNDVTFTTLFHDLQAPTKPGDLEALNISSNTLTLDWLPSTDNVGVVVYEIYQDNKKIGSTTDNNFLVKDLVPATTYTFKVKAKDEAGNYSTDATINASTLTVRNDLVNEKLSIYPNPVSDVVFINCQVPIISICITDIEGKFVEEFKSSTNPISINMKHYLSGTYVIIVKTEEFIIKRKVVKIQ